VDKMAGSNPGIIKVDEPDLRMRTMRIPALPALNLRPTVAQWNGYLVIATDDKLIREMIAVQKGAPGFTSTPEYATLSAGLPEKGNRFGLTTERFAESLTKFQGEMFANQPGATQVQAALLQRLFSNQKNVHTFCISTHLPDGWLLVSQGSQGSSQLLAPLVIAPAAIIAGVTIPAISGAHQKTAEAKSLSNAKQLCLACKNYAIDNGGNFPPSLDALFPTYLTNRSVLASPLMPGQPLGYAYTPGLKVTDAANTVIIEDTFAPLKHVRIVAYVDGSACILGTPAGATFSPSPSENPPSPPVTP